jgi:hypothetical protein
MKHRLGRTAGAAALGIGVVAIEVAAALGAARGLGVAAASEEVFAIRRAAQIAASTVARAAVDAAQAAVIDAGLGAASSLVALRQATGRCRTDVVTTGAGPDGRCEVRTIERCVVIEAPVEKARKAKTAGMVS